VDQSADVDQSNDLPTPIPLRLPARQGIVNLALFKKYVASLALCGTRHIGIGTSCANSSNEQLRLRK
jgi:hypothetical protein